MHGATSTAASYHSLCSNASKYHAPGSHGCSHLEPLNVSCNSPHMRAACHAVLPPHSYICHESVAYMPLTRLALPSSTNIISCSQQSPCLTSSTAFIVVLVWTAAGSNSDPQSLFEMVGRLAHAPVSIEATHDGEAESVDGKPPRKLWQARAIWGRPDQIRPEKVGVMVCLQC